MQQVTITCTANGSQQKADVLRRSDKSMRVVIVGTDITLNLSRTDQRALYVGNMAGLEFTTQG